MVGTRAGWDTLVLKRRYQVLLLLCAPPFKLRQRQSDISLGDMRQLRKAMPRIEAAKSPGRGGSAVQQPIGTESTSISGV